MFSQNGWPIIASGDLDKSTVPETDIITVPGTLGGDVGWLLRWVATQFNSHVEELYNPGCWGWNAPTPIPGSSIYSNHCSGTAIDLNAPSFPWKMRKMNESQIQACRDIVSRAEHVVAWGGDFTTLVDQMHFEINGTSEDVSRVVNKLREENVMPNEGDIINAFKADHRAPTAKELKDFLSKPTNAPDGLLYKVIRDMENKDTDIIEKQKTIDQLSAKTLNCTPEERKLLDLLKTVAKG